MFLMGSLQEVALVRRISHKTKQNETTRERKKNREREEIEIERERAEENKLNENEEGKWHPRSARCPAVSSSLETGKNPPHRSGIPLLFISEFYIFLYPKSCTHPLTKSKKKKNKIK